MYRSQVEEEGSESENRSVENSWSKKPQYFIPYPMKSLHNKKKGLVFPWDPGSLNPKFTMLDCIKLQHR